LQVAAGVQGHGASGRLSTSDERGEIEPLFRERVVRGHVTDTLGQVRLGTKDLVRDFSHGNSPFTGTRGHVIACGYVGREYRDHPPQEIGDQTPVATFLYRAAPFTPRTTVLLIYPAVSDGCCGVSVITEYASYSSPSAHSVSESGPSRSTSVRLVPF